ncbi:SsrA-binding protein SmpB [Candidatus Parcubacteria bacterium]|nr:SsrA-binding protein SmpB [Candidatus Parcubacteria bacterium]
MNYLTNKKAGLKYEFLERLEAGLELIGTEVKSVKAKHGSLDGSYVIIRGGEAYLVGAHIPPYQPTNAPKGYDPYRTRKVLLTKSEAVELASRDARGLTIVPLSMYNKGRKIKLEIAVVRGKQKHDKRETLRAKEDKRHIEREMKNTRG